MCKMEVWVHPNRSTWNKLVLPEGDNGLLQIRTRRATLTGKTRKISGIKGMLGELELPGGSIVWVAVRELKLLGYYPQQLTTDGRKEPATTKRNAHNKE